MYFLLEDFHDWSMLTNFDKILLKNEFLKQSHNIEFSKKREKTKKNNLIFKVLVSKNINND